MISPCSITCISTMLSAVPGSYTMLFTAKSKLISSGSRHLTCRSGSSPSGCEDTASSLDMIRCGGSTETSAWYGFSMTATRLVFTATTRCFRQIGITATPQFVPFALSFQRDCALHHKKKPLRRRAAQFAARLKLGRVLDELCTHRRTRMNNRRSTLHARKSGADESVSRQQQMIGLLGTSRLTKVMHGTSFCEKWVTTTADRADASRIQSPWPHPQPRLIRQGRG